MTCEYGFVRYPGTHIYDYLKKNKKYAPELQEETEDTFSKDLLQNFSDKDTAFQVHKVLHRLSEPYKEVFSLRVFGELSFATISSLFVRVKAGQGLRITELVKRSGRN